MKRIVCMVPEGRAKPAMLQLTETFSDVHVFIHFARGIGRRKTAVYKGFGDQGERDVLEVVVSEDRADEVFQMLFHEANVYKKRGGIIYMHTLMKSSDVVCPVESN